MATKARFDAPLQLIMSSMGDWLAGLVRTMACSPEWHVRTSAERASALRRVVVSRVNGISPENDQLFKTYFHESDGTWEILLAEIMNVHGIR